MANYNKTLHPKGNLSDNIYPNITKANIPSYAIDETKLDDLSVSESKIQNNSISTSKIKANAITSTKIANNSVTSAKLDAKSVTTSKIDDGAVTNSKIEDYTIEESKMKFRVVQHVQNYVIKYNDSYYELYITFIDTALDHLGESLASILYANVGNEVVYAISGRGYGANPTPHPVGVATDNDGTRLIVYLNDNTTIYSDDEDWEYIHLNDDVDVNLW